MLSFSVGLVVGLLLLIWSADKFVDGASSIATRMGMSRLLVGMVIVGFGTSAPEMLVSVLAAIEGKPGIALGNAYGSNITNIALILGMTVLIRPIFIERAVLTREIPVLIGVTLLSIALLWDFDVSRLDAIILLVTFGIIMFMSIRSSMREKKRYDEIKDNLENLGEPLTQENVLVADKDEAMPKKTALMWLIIGLVVLIASSRLLVWSAVGIATAFGVSEIIIGLTVVALGTSLPELASAIAATRKNEHELVIGNILGSNFFNTLAVVGLAGVIHPLTFEPAVLFRDLALVLGVTVLLFVFCIKVGKKKNGFLSRYEGLVFVLIYVLYTSYLISLVLGQPLFVLPGA